jgi:hypothetical protein
MSKLKFCFFLQIFFIFLVSPTYSKQINPYCNSEIGSSNKSSDIKYIEVKINKSRKWVRNLMNAYIAPSRTIEKKFKKRYASKLIIFFKDGSKCELETKIRLNGDFRDHIQIINNQIISSMNINISGHLENSTQIKLLLPKTRRGNNEIFISTVLRELNFLSPKISNIKVKIFERELIFLLHESVHRKEFLESTKRKESPILSKDEFFEMLHDKSYSGLGLAKVRNSKWIKNDNDKFIHSTNAITKLNIFFITLFNINRQKTYPLRGLLDGYENIFFKNKIYGDKLDFNSYNALIQAFEADAHLSSTDSRFYYNTITENFEPIYNDGFSNFIGLTKNIKKEIVTTNIKEGANKAILEIKKIKISELKKKLEENNLYLKTTEIENLLDKLLYRLKEISEVNVINKDQDILIDFEINKFLKKLTNKNLGYITYNLKEDTFNICVKVNEIKCDVKRLTLKDKKKLLEQKFKENDIKYYFLGDHKIFNPKIFLNQKYLNFKNIYNKNFKIFTNSPKEIKINEKEKNIDIFLENINTRFLFSDGEINNWTVNLHDKRVLSSQFMKNITGCVTFYKIVIKKLSLLSKNSKCEDAFNLIDTKGTIKKINLRNSEYDAIDFDFSNVIIKKAIIDSASNDCIDFSFGKYLILNAELSNCKDKAISVGEKSNIKLDNILIKNSDTGIASKDSSYTFMDKAIIEDTKNCLTAYNKKSEFNGGQIIFKNLSCRNYLNKFQTDSYSQIIKK